MDFCQGKTRLRLSRRAVRQETLDRFTGIFNYFRASDKNFEQKAATLNRLTSSRDYHLVEDVDVSVGSEDTPGGIRASLIQFYKADNPRAVEYATRGLIKHENNYSALLLEM